MKRLSQIFLILFLIAGLLGSVVYLNDKGYFLMDDFKIEVAGEKIDPIYLAPYLQNIRSRLDLYKGRSLFDLPLSSISESFENEEWIRTVSIVRRWPDQIHVRIEPKAILFAYIAKDGRTQLIDDSGEVVGPVTTENMPDVAIAQGEEFEDDHKLRKKAVELIKALPDKGSLSRETISTLHYHEAHGFWMSLVKNGLEVRMGQDDFEKKSKRVSKVLRYMEANQYEGRLIDANFDRKVLVRLKKN